MICHGYGYTIDYVLSLSIELRNLLIKQLVADRAENRLFALRLTSLSHTPGTESGARALDTAFREEYSSNVTLYKFGRDFYMTELEATDIDNDDDSGQLRYIPD